MTSDTTLADGDEHGAPRSLATASHVPRRWLLLTSALLWGSVGAMLAARAVGMALGMPRVVALPVFHVAALFGLAMFLWVFRPLAGRNSDRIQGGAARRSLFSFQTWRGYLITASMIALGVALRHSGLPSAVLSVLYAGVGVGLIVGSVVYVARFASVEGR